ncbi:MAG: WYL domain-containing protein [Clostridia bacterium]|nr:WYL domain-containing protein [Clostridia bacterium]
MMIYLAGRKNISMDIDGKKAAIICILKVLENYSSENHPLSNSEVITFVKKDFGISITPNTLRSHILILKDYLGYNIETFEDNNKGLLLIAKNDFDEEEVRVLIDSVLTSRYIPEKHAEDIISKLKKLTNEEFTKKLTHIHTINEWNHQRNKQFFGNLVCLSTAIEEKKQVEFYYNEILPDKTLKPKDNRLKCVNPYAIVCSNGQYYLICSFVNKTKLFHYRIDRMTNVNKRETAAYPITSIPGYEKGLNIAKYASEHHFMYGGKPVLVKLKMPSNRAGDIMDNFGDKATMVDLGNGTMEVYVKAVEEGMRYFALQFAAAGCEVISPQTLRDKVKDDIRELIKKYNIED